MLAFSGLSAGNRMSSDTRVGQTAATNGGIALGVEAAEHERQFREILEFCPAGLLVVDDDGRLLFHNARLREILGYSKDELDFATAACIGMISISARGSSSSYETRAARF
jgi:PAS domain S-box